MTEFAENANESEETRYNLFFMNFGYESRMKFDMMKMFNFQSV